MGTFHRRLRPERRPRVPRGAVAGVPVGAGRDHSPFGESAGLDQPQCRLYRAKTPRILDTIRAGYAHFRRIGVENPRIAVAGLNPHCGENGLFGTEDDEQIAPAVALARAEGINAVGPISADTVFQKAYNGGFDLVVAQYHDQGHIPMKLVAFDTTVNVSLGLPIDRASVDHGTAFDIAGTGKANHVNMQAAITYAKKLAGTPKVIS